MTAPLPDPILRYVRDFVARRRRFALVRAGGLAIAFALAWILVACLLDRWLALPAGARAGLQGVGLAVFAFLLLRPLRLVLRRRVDWLEAAADIESTAPAFGQRLRTVVSQLLERSEYRGSPRMIEQLLCEVTAMAQARRPRVAPSWRALILPWALAALLAGGISALRLLPDLGMAQLAARFVRPFSDIPPVTTTRITLEAPSSLPRGQALTVRAHVERLSAGPVEIFTSFNGKSWSRIAMLGNGGDGDYSFTLPSVERDVLYYVEAGDARTPVGRAQVLRPPAVVEYRIRYEYPAYTQRGSALLTSTDGSIDALAGTRATVDIACTEPIRAASITFHGHDRIMLLPTAQPSTVRFSVELRKSMSGDLELTSLAGLTTRIANGVSLRAQSDHEPIVRLLEPVDDLRLDPRAILPLQYQLMDDFALAGAWISAEVNSSAPRQLSLPRKNDARQIEGMYALDLASLNVSIGDVVAICVVGQDGAGRQVRSDVRRVLVAPRSIDLSTHQRIGELRQAATLAQTAQRELESASAALARLRGRGLEWEPDTIADHLRLSRALADALESYILAHQALLRAVPRSSTAQQATALADCVDRSRVQAALCDRLSAADAQGEIEDRLLRRLQPTLEAGKSLSTRLRTLWEGEQADAILADRGNLKLPPAARGGDGDASARLAETLRRVREEIAAAAQALGLQAQAADIEAQLTRRSEAARHLVKSARELDFVAPAAEWSRRILAGDGEAPPLPERLLSASAVEALRPGADPVYARDLLLASRAAGRLLDLPLKGDAGQPTPTASALSSFADTIQALQREHRLREAPAEATQAAAIHQAAAEARATLSAWAASSASARSGGADAEELAMEATAQAWQRHYQTARSLDHQLAMRSRGSAQNTANEDADRWVDQAERIDEAASSQDQLAARTAQAQNPQDAPGLESQQREMAEEVQRLGGDADEGNSRVGATAAMQMVQEQLAHLPQLMATAIDASDAYREAAARAQAARRDAAAADPERKGALDRVADQADGAMLEAEEILDAASSSLTSEVADEMSNQLRPFEPDTQEVRLVIAEQLQPTLGMFHQALRTGDRASVDRAAAQARSAIEITQGFLRQSQMKLIERDPLQAAKWFADASARALSERPPDFPKAHGRQANAGLALARAWQFTLRQGAMERLSLTPSFRPVLTTQPSDPRSAPAMELAPSLRQWGFLRQRSPMGLSASIRESDPPGFSEAINAYFQAMSKAQSGK